MYHKTIINKAKEGFVETVKRTFLDGVAPVTIQCSNGAQVFVTVNCIVRDLSTDSLRYFADMLAGAPHVSREITIKEVIT